MPALVIAGKHDGAVIPAGLRPLSEKLPHARFVEFENSGHFVVSGRAGSICEGGHHLYQVDALGQCALPPALASCSPGSLPNQRLKLTARVDYGMNLSSARRSLSAIR